MLKQQNAGNKGFLQAIACGLHIEVCHMKWGMNVSYCLLVVILLYREEKKIVIKDWEHKDGTGVQPQMSETVWAAECLDEWEGEWLIASCLLKYDKDALWVIS